MPSIELILLDWRGCVELVRFITLRSVKFVRLILLRSIEFVSFGLNYYRSSLRCCFLRRGIGMYLVISRGNLVSSKSAIAG